LQKSFVKNCSKSPWTSDEDELFRQIMANRTVEGRWADLKAFFPNKSTTQIYQRWTYVLDPKLRKGSWTVEEDRQIIEWVRIHGTKDWNGLIKSSLSQRTAKQCRERWTNQLESVDRDKRWTPDEDEELIRLHTKFGNQWSKIASEMNGKTNNQVKNRWYSTVSRRIERAVRGEELDLKRGPKKEQKREFSVEVQLNQFLPTFPTSADELFERDLPIIWDEETGKREEFPMLESPEENSLFNSQLFSEGWVFGKP
jgi:hypothetical protein